MTMPNATMIPETTTTASRPISRQQRQAQARQRAKSLLRAGYRFALESPARWRCHRPQSAGGGSYQVDIDRLTCTCAGFTLTGTCSHLLLALDLADAGFDPAWIAGACPHCGGPLIENARYVGGHGHVTLRECWWSLRTPIGEGCPFAGEVAP